MTDQKKSTTTAIEDTLACTAFAEEGEPCPTDAVDPGAPPQKAEEESALEVVEDDFACTAFHDENETCPICRDKKNKGP